jgi:urocanate hydratase
MIHEVTKLIELSGMFFWDYGNSFLLEGRRAGADVDKKNGDKNSIEFKYPSYVQDIMG